MSKYTTEVRFICETAYGLTESRGADSVDTIINGVLDKVFNFNFPIFDENYRSVLERKILKHYYTREIGEETVGLWKLRLNTKLNEIMPYYNKMYESELLEFNPLYMTNITREHRGNGTTDKTVQENKTENSTENTSRNTGTIENSNSNTNSTTNSSTNSNSNSNATNISSGTNSSKDYFSDTPQGSISNLEDLNYLTNARIINNNNSDNSSATTISSGNTTANISDNTNASGSGSSSTTDTYNAGKNNVSNNTISDNINTTDNYLETVVGYEGTNGSDLIMKYRETFLNIDLMIINELDVLFMQLW